MCRKEYFSAQGWWWYEPVTMPGHSVFPTDRGVSWIKSKIPTKEKTDHSSQGWKLHISVHPEEVTKFNDVVLPLLQKLRVCHKYYPQTAYKQMNWRPEGEPKDGLGKAIAVYPDDPLALKKVVRFVEGYLIENKLTFRPFPGGIPGDLLVGKTGLMYIRYGGFAGVIADQKKVYNPETKKKEKDPRFLKPFPTFVHCIPSDLLELRLEATGGRGLGFR